MIDTIDVKGVPLQFWTPLPLMHQEMIILFLAKTERT